MKWNLVVVTMFKDEAPYLHEWLCYYMALGVDHFILYDNGSTDNSSQVLTKFINAGRVTLITWPMRAGQIDAFNHAWRLLSTNAEWIGYFDVDEFVVLHDHDTIPEFLASNTADQYILPWKNFSYGGHNTPPFGTPIENYFWAAKVPDGGVVQTKHFVRANAVIHVTVHCSYINGSNTRLASGELVQPNNVIQNPNYRVAQVNHYATRSYIENVRRIEKGQADGTNHKTVAGFVSISADNKIHFDYDDSALKHFSAFAQENEKWKIASDYPHRFGLRQSWPVMSSFNVVLHYLAQSFGNYLLNEKNIRPGTEYKFQIKKESGDILLLPSFINWSRTSLHFSLQEESIFKNFLGTVHYGDFARRFGFYLQHSTREKNVDNDFSVSISCSNTGWLALADVECKTAAVVRATSNNEPGLIADEAIPQGRSCVLIYIPVLKNEHQEITLSIKGECVIREILLGTLAL